MKRYVEQSVDEAQVSLRMLEAGVGQEGLLRHLLEVI